MISTSFRMLVRYQNMSTFVCTIYIPVVAYLKEFSISLGRDLSKQHVLNLCYCGLTGTEHLNMTMSEKYTYNCYK